MFAICSSCEFSILCEVMMNRGLRPEPEISAAFTYSLLRYLPVWCDPNCSCRVAYPEIHSSQSKTKCLKCTSIAKLHSFFLYVSISRTVNWGQKVHNSEGEKSTCKSTIIVVIRAILILLIIIQKFHKMRNK